ncbi:MAG: aminoacyl-histidine dipeptidase [Tannerellaceae bacterium]|jgi:dipeptidase D|nr:aminoacyl-histidine dipeptidase [Tannerellaceae bacterium]
MKITELEPRDLWNFFYEVTQVPRPSKREGKMIAYLERFARERKLEVRKDKAGNVLIHKPATKGFEHLPTVILQSHIDMVCESDTPFNFDDNPIRTVIDGEWVRADGTTLGADNGIGVAAQLAILDGKLPHGSIECLFTVDEETGLTGANALQEGFLSGDILLNLDSEDEGELFISCAGGKTTTATLSYKPVPVSNRHIFIRFTVSGLRGGHSGCDIHEGRANANKILAHFLYTLRKKWKFRLAEIKGGDKHNAIPRQAVAVVGLHVNSKYLHSIVAYFNASVAKLKEELKDTEPNLSFTMSTTTEGAQHYIDPESTDVLLSALVACPHGVLGVSNTISGLVETSTNLAVVETRTCNYEINIVTSQRSSVEVRKNTLSEEIATLFLLAGFKVTTSDGYPGWPANEHSRILQAAKDSYRRLFGKEPGVRAIHAGLECGLFLEKYPHLDMVSFGPTLRDVHSPNERLHIPSVERWWLFLCDLLRHIPPAA